MKLQNTPNRFTKDIPKYFIDLKEKKCFVMRKQETKVPNLPGGDKLSRFRASVVNSLPRWLRGVDEEGIFTDNIKIKFTDNYKRCLFKISQMLIRHPGLPE